MRRWDNSFAGYKLSLDRRVRYSTSRGNVQAIGAPISVFYTEARDKISPRGEHDLDHVIMVTNRLAWGDARGADYVIGTGVVCNYAI
jgi:hypothetical protein